MREEAVDGSSAEQASAAANYHAQLRLFVLAVVTAMIVAC
jgi:hypothetical protein